MLVRWTSSRCADWETRGSDDTHTICSHTSDRVLHYREEKMRTHNRLRFIIREQLVLCVCQIWTLLLFLRADVAFLMTLLRGNKICFILQTLFFFIGNQFVFQMKGQNLYMGYISYFFVFCLHSCCSAINLHNIDSTITASDLYNKATRIINGEFLFTNSGKATISTPHIIEVNLIPALTALEISSQ